MGVTVKQLSHNNVWEWLLKQSVFQLLLKSRQRSGRRDIVRKPVPELCCCNRKSSTADGWQLERRHLQTVRSKAGLYSPVHNLLVFDPCSSTRHVGDMDQRTEVAWCASTQGFVCQKKSEKTPESLPWTRRDIMNLWCKRIVENFPGVEWNVGVIKRESKKECE